MSEETANKKESTGKEESPDADKLIEATKKLADKAENYVAETAKKVKVSEAFSRLSEIYHKVENMMEEKSEEFRKSDMADRLEALKDKAGSKAEELIQKARVAGEELADEVDEAIDAIKDKIDRNKGGDKQDKNQ